MLQIKQQYKASYIIVQRFMTLSKSILTFTLTGSFAAIRDT